MTGLRGSGAPPLIVRVAGLSAEAMAPFSDRRLIEVLAERERLGKRLDEVRAVLVNRLHEAIHKAAREERRFLLSVKRRCFNGGALRPFRQDSQWPLLIDIDAASAAEVVSLEGAAEEVEARFEELYGRALRHERECLVELLGNRAFVRGVALASPTVARNLDRLNGREPEGFGRREKRLCLTFLRYASRAALKLSPFSTLTRTGLALAAGDTPADLTLLPADVWHEKSTVALRRELLAQCCCLLLRCPGFAEDLEVALNETLAIDGDGCCSLFRPGRWEFDDESSSFSYREASMVKARLEGPLVPWLIAELSEGPRVCRPLLARARAAFDDESSDMVAEGMAGLFGIGFLNAMLPWDFSRPDLERQILARLEALPDGTGLEGFREGLRELIQVLEGYAGAAAPARFVEAVQHGVEGLFHALAPAAGLAPRIEFKAYEKTFEEDVFLLPQDGTQGIAHLSRERMRELLANLDPLARLINLQSSLHDLRCTLAAFGERRWPGAREIRLLEFFDAARPLFDQYLRHRGGPSGGVPPAGFNPLDLESVSSLARWRRAVERGLGGCFEDGGDGQRLCPLALATLLEQRADGPTHPYAFCAFVQPLDSRQRQWVLNTITDGFGRLGSRFTSGMDSGTRDGWTAYFTARSLFECDGEPVELVDVTCPGLRTINVHAPQTRRVLKMPGEHASLAPERVLRLSDLRVRLRGADLAPVLTDRTGRRLLPVQHGGLAAGGAPTLLKFVGIFGPGERFWRLPSRAPRMRDGIEVLDRHLLGPIVYIRKQWGIAPRELLARIERCGEAEAFATIHRWRMAQGIPDRVFVREPIPLPGSFYRYKPQYISFLSPSFVQIFRSMLTMDVSALVLEESLPDFEQFPPREGRQAVEVQLESFAFQDEFPSLVSCERKRQQPARQA